MRRIIHNSTAIAASIALLMPQIAAAELRLPNGEAANQAESRAANMPDLASVLQIEVEKGLTADGLICANGNARPCGDRVRLLTPRGVVVQVARNGTIILAPKGQQVNSADAAGNLTPLPNIKGAVVNPAGPNNNGGAEAAANAAAANIADAARNMIAKPDQTATIAEANDDGDVLKKAMKKLEEQRAEADAEAAAEAAAATAAADEAKAAEKAKAKAEAKAAADAKDAAKDAAKAQARQDKANADAASEDALAKALAAQMAADKKNAKAQADAAASAEQQANAAATAEAEQQAQASAKLRLKEGEDHLRRMHTLPGLAGLLQRELAAGLTTNDLVCQTGDAPPCEDGVALMTPGGVAVAVNKGEVTILPRARQTNTMNAEGQVIARAPEADTVETAAAKEAAEAAAAPAAAALEAIEGQGRMVEEEQVTDANTRSSNEDFEASLRAALEQAGQQTGASGSQQQNTAAGDDNDSDLAKALILGLGAVAVGQMLNNNRQVALSAPDRVVVQRADGSQEVIKDEVALLRQPGSTVTTENFDDGSSRTIVTREDGSKVVTIRDADLRVLRRTLISADGTSTMLIDDTADVRPVDVATLPAPAPVQTNTGTLSEDELRAALQRESNIDRRFTLGQIRNIPEVRALVAPVNIDAITFDTGSAAINPDQARQLATVGRVIQDAIAKNPREIFMIEGHTDTVGSNAMNLALSDRRAESVALALAEYFDVPPENMVVQGYGEQFLKVRAEGDIRSNRRASLRRITDLLQTAQAN